MPATIWTPRAKYELVSLTTSLSKDSAITSSTHLLEPEDEFRDLTLCTPSSIKCMLNHANAKHQANRLTRRHAVKVQAKIIQSYDKLPLKKAIMHDHKSVIGSFKHH
jgi:hypothetical protein